MKIIIIILCFSSTAFSQDIALLNQFNGTVDFTMFGNTLNYFENGAFDNCSIQTSSSAQLNLDPSETVIAAYLYWAGSGQGDFQVELNGTVINAERTFNDFFSNEFFFSAFADVTTQIQNTGNSLYTLSELDLTGVIGNYCNFGGNFGGWAIVVVYNNDTLPDNLINIYDGMQSIPNDITITLDNLQVVDNNDAKIGFLAWEGDSAIANNESLRINGNLISNPPLNPGNNAFNGTNSFTGATDLYNMDLDFYNIENNIQPGDTTATIEMTSSQDYVMINCVVVKLNTQLPDATCQLNNYSIENCNERTININFDINNTDLATTSLIANLPISIYANDTYVATFYTQNVININATDNYSFNVTIPNNIPNNFELKLIADDNNGTPIIFEIDENNNESTMQVTLPQIPIANNVETQFTCEEEPNITDGISLFDTSTIQTTILGQLPEQQNMEVLYFDQLGNALPSPLPNPFMSSTQTIEVIVQNPINTSCTASVSIDFIVVPLPEFEVDDDIICYESFPETTFVSIYNPVADYDYEWFNADFELIGLNQNTLEIFSSGNYYVTATSQIYDCTTTKEFSIVNEQVVFNKPQDILMCNEGFESAVFNLENVIDQVIDNDIYQVSFFTSIAELHTNENKIITATNYTNLSNPQTIFVKVLNTNSDCYNYTSFDLLIENCFPIVPQLFTPNLEENNTFHIRNLRDVFVDFELKIFNRYGSIIYSGNNNTLDWDGTYKGGSVATGTYFYVLRLNDNYFESKKGWVYLVN